MKDKSTLDITKIKSFRVSFKDTERRAMADCEYRTLFFKEFLIQGNEILELYLEGN